MLGQLRKRLVGLVCVGALLPACSDFKLVVNDLSSQVTVSDLSASADLSLSACASDSACTYPKDSCSSGSQCYPFGMLATAGPGYCLPVLFRTGCSHGVCSGGAACYLAYDFCLTQEETACVCAATPAACGF